MKKILGTALAVVLFVPWTASAELFSNLKVSGSLDVQSTSARNVSDFRTVRDAVGGTNNDRIGNTLTRIILNADWDMLDDVHSNITLRKNNRAWGTIGSSGQGAGGNESLIVAPGGAGDAASNVYVQRASVKIDKLFGHFDTTVGRQYYGKAGDLVIYFGPKDNFGLYVTAIDAFRLDMENDMMTFSGMAGTTAGTVAFGVGQANTHVRGFDIGWKGLPVKVNTYVWNRLTQGAGALGIAPSATVAATGLNDNLYVYGLKFRGEAAGGWFGAEIAANSGQDRTTTAGGGCTPGLCPAGSGNYIGKALLVDAGYNMEVANVGGFTPWLNFGYGTGRSSNYEASNENFTAIASDYRPGIMNRRFGPGSFLNLGATIPGVPLGGIGTTGLGNRVVYGLGVNMTPAAAEKLTVGLAFWDYRFQRSTIWTAVGDGKTALGNKHIGHEFGVTADWRHSEHVTFGIGAASFQPGGFVKELYSAGQRAGTTAATDNPATMAFADLSVKF